MTAYDIMLSESQERMVFVVERGREEEAMEIFRKWDLDTAVIGKVTDDGALKASKDGQQAINLPIDAVVKGALKCERPTRRPAWLDAVQAWTPESVEIPERGDALLKALLASPNIASRHSVYEQYDHMVRLNTLVLPGSDAAVTSISAAIGSLRRSSSSSTCGTKC